MKVVVLNHSIVSTHVAHVHREGCRDIERDTREHASTVYGPFDSVDEALADYLDEEMIELGYGESDVRVFPCCERRTNRVDGLEGELGEEVVAAVQSAAIASSDPSEPAGRSVRLGFPHGRGGPDLRRDPLADAAANDARAPRARTVAAIAAAALVLVAPATAGRGGDRPVATRGAKVTDCTRTIVVKGLVSTAPHLCALKGRPE